MTAWQGYTTAAPSLVHRACAQGPDVDVTGCLASALPNPSTSPAVSGARAHTHTDAHARPPPNPVCNTRNSGVQVTKYHDLHTLSPCLKGPGKHKATDPKLAPTPAPHTKQASKPHGTRESSQV